MSRRRTVLTAALFATCLLALAAAPAASDARETHQTQKQGARTEPRGAWIFFDLGNTLIDSRTMDQISFLPGAEKHLTTLSSQGYHLGLIVNVPQDWGKTREEKLARLKVMVSTGWTGERPFNWDLFEAVLVPPDDERRKPAPDLFLEAMEIAGNAPVAYQGEDGTEIERARSLGMHVYQVWLPGRAAYMPRDLIAGLASRR